MSPTPPTPPATPGAIVRELGRQTLVVSLGWLIVTLPLWTAGLTVATLVDPAAPRRGDVPLVIALVALAGATVAIAVVAVRGPLRGWWDGAAGAGRRSLLCLAGVLVTWVPWVFVDVAVYAAG